MDEAITGGSALITGNFTVDSAKTLVERFNAGALPAPIKLVNQQTVSATLGNNSLKNMIFAAILGTLLVILFMLFYYRLFGFFAACALIIYIALTLGVFKLIGITMSLSGIAGFVLTIGMAVDANILTFERIKEEQKRGLPRTSAVEEGFRRAWPSIRDSNTSTIITAVILYYFTSSFVQGFALTLLIGVLVSLFSAITTTRLFLRVYENAGSGKQNEDHRYHNMLNIVGHRKIWFTVSGILVGAAIVAMVGVRFQAERGVQGRNALGIFSAGNERVPRRRPAVFLIQSSYCERRYQHGQRQRVVHGALRCYRRSDAPGGYHGAQGPVAIIQRIELPIHRPFRRRRARKERRHRDSACPCRYFALYRVCVPQGIAAGKLVEIRLDHASHAHS